MEICKIALVGPESTGKSTLAAKLAAHFNSSFVPEYAREYLERGKMVSSPRDILHIAQIQLALTKAKTLSCPRPLLFCDTDFHNLVVWSQHAFGYCEPELLTLEEEQHFDLYLLLSPDIPWVDDGQRYHPHLRHKFHDVYKKRLTQKKRHFVEIAGDGDARFRACIEALGFNNKKSSAPHTDATGIAIKATE